MAEKLSINIDLRASRHVNQQPATVHKNKAHTNYKDVPVEFSYRYDRMFTVTVLLIVIIIALYYVVSAIYPEPDKMQSASKISAVQQIIKEKNLLIAPQTTLQITSENNQRPIFLFYDSIDVLETFHSEPVIQQASSKEQITTSESLVLTTTDELPTKPENAKLNSTDELSEPDFEPGTPPAESSMPSNVLLAPETVSPEIVSSEMVSPEIPISEQKPKIKYPEKQSIVPVKEPDEPFIQIFSDNLSRVLLVSNIYKKEPVNKLSYWVTGPADRAEKVYLFTQLNNSTEQMLEHQWWYQGKMLSNKKFTALGNRWRCYSSKNIGKFQQGKWMIKVLDQNGQLLSSVNFHYQIN